MINYAEILVIDDMPEQITYSGNILRAEGYRVFAATSGKAVYRYLERHTPNLILLDIQMSDTSGFEICKKIKENPKTQDIPVIFITAKTNPELITQCFEAGGCDYIKKPFVKEEYLGRIENHIMLSVQRKQLIIANDELTQFCSAVSHDLKAPFNIINMLIEMLQQELGDNQSESIATIMDMIVSKCTKTKTMIERLFEFSKMCNVTPKMKSVDIGEIAKETFEELKSLSPDRDIQFICNELPMIKGDETLIRIMLKNLLQNAIKYTSKKEKAVIEISGGSNLAYNIITIKDNGAGFDMAYYDKLFQVFERLHTEENFEGSGVGLALIKRIIERHRGHIEAYGEVDKGAEFSLYFPKRIS